MKCPICLSNSNFKLIQEPNYNLFSYPLNYSMYGCGSCDTAFAHPFEAAQSDFYDYTVPDWRWEFGEFINDFNHIDEHTKILEIGCNRGNFLEQIKHKNRKNLYGLDFNQEAIAKARSKGFNCYATTLESFQQQNPELKFDIICFFHVLEHLDQPEDFFNTLFGMLTKEGKIVFSVPNPNRIMLACGRDSWDYPPNHLTRFSLPGIKQFLNRLNFKPVSIKAEPKDLNFLSFLSFSVYYFLHKIGIKWPYDTESNISKLKKIIFKLPLFICLSPLAAVKYYKSRSKSGLALYIICQKKL